MFKDIRATIEIDLTKSLEYLWNNLDKDARWGVKKAKKEGLEVIEAHDERKLEEFYGIYKQTIIAGKIAPEKLEKLTEKDNLLFVCKRDNKIIAGAIIILKENRIELKFNASLHEYLKFQPNNFLYWKLIEWGKKNGYKIFDLGGYQLNAKKGNKLYEVNKFKLRWGGEIRKYPVYSKNLFYILGRKIIRNLFLIKKIRDWFKLKIYLKKYSREEKSLKIFNILIALFEKFIYANKTIIVFEINTNNFSKIIPNIDVKLKKFSEEELKNSKFLLSKNFLERIKKGYECFAFLDKEKIIHYSWVTYDKMDIREVSKKINLEKWEACIFDCYTLTEYRGKSIYPAMLSRIQSYLNKKEIKKCYIYVDEKNKPSIKGVKKVGFVEYQKIKYINFFGLKELIEDTKTFI